ncbi:hypothetical protein HDU76_012969, partial [Blyttiomyces sp. JEL0837]
MDISMKLTRIFCVHAFGVDLDQAGKEEMDGKSTQRLRAASIQSARMRSFANSVVTSLGLQSKTPHNLTHDKSQTTSLISAHDTASILSTQGLPEAPHAANEKLSTNTTGQSHNPAPPISSSGHSAEGNASISEKATAPIPIASPSKGPISWNAMSSVEDDSSIGSFAYAKMNAHDMNDAGGPNSPIFARRGDMHLSNLKEVSKGSMHSIRSLQSLEGLNERSET